MKRVISLVLLVILLNSCSATTAVITEATATAEVAPTTAAINTTTVEATSANQSIQDLALAFGWNTDRTYVEGERNGQQCALDTYNQACMATYDAATNSWIEVDETTSAGAELKYGHLAPKDIEYINTEKLIWNDGSESFEVYAVYLGDITWENAMYKGKTYEGPLTMAYAKIGIWDEKEFHVANYALGAIKPDGSGFKDTYLASSSSGGSERVFVSSVKDVIDALKPGDVFRWTMFPPRVHSPSDITIDVYESALIPGIVSNDRQDKFTQEDWEALAQGIWPDREVGVYDTGNGVEFTTQTQTQTSPVLRP